MIITAQKGKANKIHISIDGEYKLTVDADFWFSCGYISGDEIDEEQYKTLADRIAKRRCFNRALNILSRRDHCEKELYNKLRRADGDAAAQDAVDRIKALGYINDERYACNLAEELAARKGYGIRAIRAELLHRGIDREIAENTINSITLDESDNIRVLLNGKFSRKLTTEKGRKQVFASLLRLGYSYSDIRSAMSEYDEFGEEYDI
ncbi:MAG: regulatory protein RecX [Clostridia bacterium]|nr:regulatory protein RecX [Clostridia bacterium]